MINTVISPNRCGHGSHLQSRFIGFCLTHSIDLMILPPHSSHITQPLDVSVFGPLKAAMARVTSHAATYDGGRIPKDVWASRLAAARSSTMTFRNIHSGWKATGLHPFHPSTVLDSLSDLSESAPLALGPSRIPLATLSNAANGVLRTYGPSTPAPVKNLVNLLVSSMEGSTSKVAVLNKEDQGYRGAIDARKRPRAGITVNNEDTHLFSTEYMRDKKAAREAATAATKGKGRKRAALVDSPDLLHDIRLLYRP